MPYYLDPNPGNGGAVGAFVAPSVGVDVGIGIALGEVAVFVGGVLAPNSTASDDTTVDDSQAYVFHFTSNAAAAAILATGQINTGATSGLAWVTPSPYTTASLAQAQLSLPSTPDGFFAIPVQNLQTPLTWSTAPPMYNQPGGGVEGTTPVRFLFKGRFGSPSVTDEIWSRTVKKSASKNE